LEIWRTEWLEHLEYFLPQSSSDQYLRQKKELSLAWIRKFGSVEDILAMIEEGDQGEDLRPRVNAIRENLVGMQALRELWVDKRLDDLVEGLLDY
jgi:hypothetical protein